MSQDEDRAGQHPYQTHFFILGSACFGGSVVAGFDQADHAALCIALAILSATFYTLFTWIHLRH